MGNHGNVEVTPFDLLHRLNKTFVCQPGRCGLYSSTGYELLGLALVHLSGINTTWKEYDQMSVFPPKIRGNYHGTNFHGSGPCSDDNMIVHQYLPTKIQKSKKINNSIHVNLTIVDIYNNSCLNGWVCGNVAVTPLDAARFHFDLQNGHIVSKESLADMMNFDQTTEGWEPQPYGLGMMRSFPGASCGAWPPDPENDTFTVGHAGEGYGSMGHLAGYNIKHNFGIALFSGSQGGLNCSNYSLATPFTFDFMCNVYSEVLSIVSNGTVAPLNCSLCANGRPCPCLIADSKYCIPTLKEFCPGYENRSTPGKCLACIHNRTSPNYKRILQSRCSPKQHADYCGNASQTCPTILEKYCGNTLSQPGLCVRCASNRTHLKELASAGCSTKMKLDFCRYPASSKVCEPLLENLCKAARGDPHTCFYCVHLNRTNRQLIQNVGCNQTQGDNFCGPSPTCIGNLTSACGSVRSNTTMCTKCLKKVTTERISAKAACTLTQQDEFCGISPVPSPAKPKINYVVDECRWDL